MNKKFKVYLHISPSAKYYVGITSLKDVKERWGKDGHGYNTQYFSRAIDKYGWNNFIHITVMSGLAKKEACELEKFLIEQLKSNDPKYGYNISNGGECTALGLHHSDDAKRKIAERFSEPVDQYDMNGLLIKSWNSMRNASRKLNVDSSSIAKCCKGIYKTSKGYVWRYHGVPFDKYTLKKYSQKKRMIEIKQFSIGGELIKVWSSLSLAADVLNLSTSSISACCKGEKGRKSYGGYVWRYMNDDFDKFDIRNKKFSSVNQYNRNGNYLNSYISIAEASRAMGVSKSNISMCCSGYINTAGGYSWKYSSDGEVAV